jgi:Tol biopolymer transport system component
LIGAGETRAVIVDVAARAARVIEGVDQIPDIGGWSDRKARWNPWSKDGRFFTYLRKGQVWIAAPDGSNARQLTFDSTKKAFPTFSRSGKRIAYVAYQYDHRLFYSRPGPTDLWVVDVDTTMAARLTDPNPDRIHSLDWLDDDTVLFDRVDVSRFSDKSSLRRISMK